MKCRLMLVDDDATLRALLGELVRASAGEDFEIVAEAGNGREAVEAALLHRPDVILMDVRMPLCDGIQATRRIKQEHRLGAVVITATSYAWSEIRAEAEEAGASLHVQKPFDMEKVKEALQAAKRRVELAQAVLTAG